MNESLAKRPVDLAFWKRPVAGTLCRGRRVGHNGPCGEVAGRNPAATLRVSISEALWRMVFHYKSRKPSQIRLYGGRRDLGARHLMSRLSADRTSAGLDEPVRRSIELLQLRLSRYSQVSRV